MPFGKPKEPKPPKAPKEKKPKKPKKEKPPKVKKGKKGQPAPEVEGQEQEQEQGKKKLPLPLLLIPVVVLIAAAAVFFIVIRPRMNADADPDATVSVEPEPPVLPTEIPIGDDVTIVGLALEADESGALAEKAKTITYRYTNLVDAGKAAQTYVAQLAHETPSFALVDEEFVQLNDQPDYTAAEGMVLLARNVPVEAPEATDPPEEASPEAVESPDPDASAEPAPTSTPEPEPEPTEPPVTYVHTVRITWSPGLCVVTADEQEGRVTSPPPSSVSANHSVSQHSAKQILQEMNPADLELAGESMAGYEVMPMDGTEIVDGNPCIRLYVFSDDNQPQSNEIMGSYLMSIDGEHLYKVDNVTNEIKELDYTPNWD